MDENKNTESTESLDDAVNEATADETSTDAPTEVIDETAGEETTSGEAAPTKKRRLGKKGWIAVAVAAAVVLTGVGIAAPVIIENQQLAAAQSAFGTAVDQLDTATADYNDAVTAYGARVAEAAASYEVFRQIATSLPAELVDPAEALTTLTDANAAFIAATALTLNEDGTVAAEQEASTFKVGGAPKAGDTKVELDEQADDVLAAVASASAQAAKLNGAVKDLDANYDETVEALDALVLAAAAKGATIDFEKDAAGENDALKAAVAGLVVKNAEGTALTVEEKQAAIKTYVDAYTAAKASHDATVAAEAAEAERLAAEAQRSSGGGNGGGNGGGGSRGGWNGGGSGGGNTGGGSTGGGNTGGGNTGGGNTGGGNTGGGTAPSVGPRGSISKSGSACQGSGGGASGNWASNLVAPADAKSVWVSSENPGASWAIKWECDMGW